LRRVKIYHGVRAQDTYRISW